MSSPLFPSPRRLVPLQALLHRDTLSIYEVRAKGAASLARLSLVCQTEGFHEAEEQAAVLQRAAGKQAALHFTKWNRHVKTLSETYS